ncbi:MAG TPA: SMI1/KNR4 family protein [Pyrinomonadaceae bacterium]|jgi:hypothetical protein
MEFKAGTALPPPSDELIAWFEKTFRVRLPPDYVATLKAGNGAIPLTNLFEQGGRERLIEEMLCMLETPRADPIHGVQDISVVMTQVEEFLVDDEDLVGMNVIPFAQLFGGDLLCLDCRTNPETPAVVVWDHERSRQFEPHLEKVADSFAEFDAMLRKSHAD